MINKNTQLGYVVWLLRGLGHYFYGEDEKPIFDLRPYVLERLVNGTPPSLPQVFQKVGRNSKVGRNFFSLRNTRNKVIGNEILEYSSYFTFFEVGRNPKHDRNCYRHDF